MEDWKARVIANAIAQYVQTMHDHAQASHQCHVHGDTESCKVAVQLLDLSSEKLDQLKKILEEHA